MLASLYKEEEEDRSGPAPFSLPFSFYWWEKVKKSCIFISIQGQANTSSNRREISPPPRRRSPSAQVHAGNQAAEIKDAHRFRVLVLKWSHARLSSDFINQPHRLASGSFID